MLLVLMRVGHLGWQLVPRGGMATAVSAVMEMDGRGYGEGGASGATFLQARYLPVLSRFDSPALPVCLLEAPKKRSRFLALLALNLYREDPFLPRRGRRLPFAKHVNGRCKPRRLNVTCLVLIVTLARTLVVGKPRAHFFSCPPCAKLA